MLFDHAVQELDATVVRGSGTEAGQIIAMTIGGKNGQPKQVVLLIHISVH